MSSAATPLGFTWVRVRVSGDGEETGVSPGIYVDAAEVVAYLNQYDPASVVEVLDQLIADNPPATASGWVVG